MSAGFKLDELSARAGVSPRTVRYYVQRGLLPAPAFRGPDTAYDEGHLVRLRAIRALQDAYWPLDAIASALASRSIDEIRAIADGALPPSSTSAPVPAATPAPVPAATPATRGVRHRLAPGLELFLEDDATDEARALAESILTLTSKTLAVTRTPKGGSTR